MPYTREPQEFGKALREDAVAAEARAILNACTNAKEIEGWVDVPRFGLDLAFFIRRAGCTRMRLVELKSFRGCRNGGVGFGKRDGTGPQVDILMLDASRATLIDDMVRWLVADGREGVSRGRLGAPRHDSSIAGSKRSFGRTVHWYGLLGLPGLEQVTLTTGHVTGIHEQVTVEPSFDRLPRPVRSNPSSGY